MASQTPNMDLRKPTNNDTVNVVTDLSANFDKIDAHGHSGTYVPLSGNPNTGATKLYLGPALPNSGPLTQFIIKDDNTPVTGRPDLAPFEFMHDGATAGYIFHLTCGPNMGSAITTGAALIGMGIDNAGTGLFVNNKATGIGIKITQNDTISAANAYGMLVNCGKGSAPGVWFQQDPGAAVNGPAACVFFAYAATHASQRLVEWRRPSVSTPTTGELIGYVDSTTGRLVWQSQLYTQPDVIATVPMQVTGLAGQTADLQRWDVSGTGTLAKVNKDGTLIAAGVESQIANAYFNLYNTTGTANQRRYQFSDSSGNFLITARNDANTNQGTIFQVKHSNGDITPKDGATIIAGATTGLKIGNASSKLGFFNATAIVKPTGVTVDAAGIHAALVSLGLIAA
jgi:hypothetical protein